MGSFDGPRTPIKGELAVNLMSKREKEDVSIYTLNLDRMGQFPSFLYDFLHHHVKEVSGGKNFTDKR